MAAKMLVRYRTKMLKRPEEIQDVSFLDLKRAIPVILFSLLSAFPNFCCRPSASPTDGHWYISRLSVFSQSYFISNANLAKLFIVSY
jgi:hypothetical protein